MAKGIFLVLFFIFLITHPGEIFSAGEHPLFGVYHGYYQMSPLIGSDYISQLIGNGVLAKYDLPEVRDLVVKQLRQMKNNGVEVIRINLIVWNIIADPEMFAGQNPHDGWGWVPADDQRILEPYRTNIKNYVSDVKAAGIEKLMVSYGAHYPNKQTAVSRAQRDFPMLVDILDLIRQYGPIDIKVDLYGEGSPFSLYDQERKNWMIEYCSEILRLYYEFYNRSDAVVSFIINNMTMPYIHEDLEILLTIYRNASLINPPWIQFSLYPGINFGDPIEENTFLSLKILDSELRSANLPITPLIIAETYYDSPEVAKGIARFREISDRPILWLIQWPILTDNITAPAPPYNVDAYRSFLEPLKVSISPSIINKGDMYNLYIYNNYSGYSGYLEIKYTRCDLTGNNCHNNNANAPEKWCYYNDCFFVNNGLIGVDTGSRPDISSGIYTMRFRPWDSVLSWSDPVTLVINSTNTVNSTIFRSCLSLFVSIFNINELVARYK